MARRATHQGPDPATTAALRYLCQTDLYALLYDVLNRGLPPARNVTETLHKPLCTFIQTTRTRRNLYLLQRGSIKTGVITVARNVQRILVNPEIRILISSNKAENAQDMLREIKGHLVNPILLQLFPEILYPDPARQSPKWTESDLIVKRTGSPKESTVETIGVTGELTSKHYDHMTFDDVVGKENSQTREARQQVKKFLQIAQSLADPGATQDFVGTPWDLDDAWAWLKEQRAAGLPVGLYEMPCWVPDPAGVEVPGYGPVRATFPERFFVDVDLTRDEPGKENLLFIRKIKGTAEFAAQYLLNPVPSETAYFPRDKITVRARRELPPADRLWTVMTVDPAISTKDWADYSALAVTGFDGDGLMHLLDLRRGRWEESELIAQIYDAYARHPQIHVIGFEAIAWQKMFRHLMVSEGERRGLYLPVVKLERDTKQAKNTRIRALEPYWSAGEIVIAAECPAREDFLEEAERWRPDKENTHDDLLDAVVDSLQLRLRPDQQAPTHEPLFEDPDVADRAAWEQSVLDDRKARGLAPLDRAALRLGYQHHRLTQSWEQEQAAKVGAGVMSEWM